MDEKQKTEKKEKYEVQDGFVHAPVIRGFGAIRPLWVRLVKTTFICGGYVRFMCSMNKNPIEAGDVDVYCKDEDAFLRQSKVLEQHLNIRHESDVAITFSRPEERDNPFYHCPAVQLIRPIREGAIVANGEMEEIIDNFDFSVIRGALLSPETALVDANFDHDEEKLILRIRNIHCPISSMFRCVKYSKKGYFMPPSEAVKLFLDWEQRDEAYRMKIVEYLEKARDGEGLSKEEVDELEALMQID
jgi:hypothetical protein